MSDTTRWRIVPAAWDHIPPIAAGMRDADRREVMASHGHSPREALEASLACSALAWTGLIRTSPSPAATEEETEYTPALMWGVARREDDETTGAPWLLATPDILRVKGVFLRRCRLYVESMQDCFPRLANFVHAENNLSRRWLVWCGFHMAETPVFIGDEPFLFFWKERNNNVCGKKKLPHMSLKQALRSRAYKEKPAWVLPQKGHKKD